MVSQAVIALGFKGMEDTIRLGLSLPPAARPAQSFDTRNNLLVFCVKGDPAIMNLTLRLLYHGLAFNITSCEQLVAVVDLLHKLHPCARVCEALLPWFILYAPKPEHTWDLLSKATEHGWRQLFYDAAAVEVLTRLHEPEIADLVNDARDPVAARFLTRKARWGRALLPTTLAQLDRNRQVKHFEVPWLQEDLARRWTGSQCLVCPKHAEPLILAGGAILHPTVWFHTILRALVQAYIDGPPITTTFDEFLVRRYRKIRAEMKPHVCAACCASMTTNLIHFGEHLKDVIREFLRRV